MTAAERQKNYREREELGLTQHRRLLDEMIQALDRGRCSKFADNLPEDVGEKVEEMIRRLQGARLVACRIDTDGNQGTAKLKKARQATSGAIDSAAAAG